MISKINLRQKKNGLFFQRVVFQCFVHGIFSSSGALCSCVVLSTVFMNYGIVSRVSLGLSIELDPNHDFSFLRACSSISS